MRLTLVLPLSVLLLQFSLAKGAAEDSSHDHTPPPQSNSTPTPELTSPQALPHQQKILPPSLLSQGCVSEKYTRSSCAKVFCPPWERCINERCVCKLPYQCPRIGPQVCALNGRAYLSMCQTRAIACRDKSPFFSHYASLGQCSVESSFTVSLVEVKGQQVIVVSAVKKNLLICGSDSWNIAAANVVCRQINDDARGARATSVIKFMDAAEVNRLSRVHECISVRCTGAEHTLAECILYKRKLMNDDSTVATATCYKKEVDTKECNEFRCVNEKCVSWEDICDGIDHCGDNSDEMCCTGCQKGAFFCKTGVCLPPYAVRDQIRDCLGGEDELETSALSTGIKPKKDSQLEPLGKESDPEKESKDEVWSDPTEDIRKIRNHTDTLECGIPNMDYVYKTEEETKYRRTKRVVGGDEALPTQIQWQVAVQDEGKIHCGGVYLGGCWVLTAAHCVRPKPQAFRIKFSVWNKLSLLNTSDSIPVKNIIIHHSYNAQTYENDIALIQLKELNNEKRCLRPNPAVRPVCVPWSSLQFPPHYTCTISGWGRNKEGESVNILKWANVSLIPHCGSYYKERYYDGMMCAGDLEGDVDSCQGDSGGPLVCKDASGVSYVWGIVSWGEKCGEAGFPGVYTKVAHYFEWIRQHTDWAAVTKYN